ncbi:hypothetical protein EDD98_7686 [Streptomyces sp. PanSC19]|uniref:hypothetical protein n=1 Tax=Streptomyces sp. PanSC19 TaxID=1520455 RepID=UPI000F48457D|nr:hypothetical protein [Streptomyces sp. PanSC19]ROQ23236.1 hypothetical protein EDD98_7686 [Streptomyces sp. PanSC19]
MLALAVLNCGKTAAWLSETYLYELSLYTFIVSPRQDDLVLITHAASNIANRLLPGEHKSDVLCLPGMRLLDDPDDAYRLIHLPTGGRLTTTNRSNGTGGGRSYPARSWKRVNEPLTSRETEVLDALPPMTSDAEALLAALTSRLWLRDPYGSWAIGGWFSPPPRRDRETIRSHGHARRLDGSGDQWELTWTSYPYPEDLVAALSHPRAGLRGVRVLREGEVVHLLYGTARLSVLPTTRATQGHHERAPRIWR